VADVEERVTVAASPARVYDLVSRVDRLARWSPECFAVWVTRRRDGLPARFVGFNRRKGYVWFTTCRVAVAEPGREFAFDVSTFGLPVARWGYRFAETSSGTEVTEYWIDRRSRGAYRMGRIFTGRAAAIRPAVNREGMRITLDRLANEVDAPAE
jgi:hypothetical protein